MLPVLPTFPGTDGDTLVTADLYAAELARTFERFDHARVREAFRLLGGTALLCSRDPAWRSKPVRAYAQIIDWAIRLSPRDQYRVARTLWPQQYRGVLADWRLVGRRRRWPDAFRAAVVAVGVVVFALVLGAAL